MDNQCLLVMLYILTGLPLNMIMACTPKGMSSQDTALNSGTVNTNSTIIDATTTHWEDISNLSDSISNYDDYDEMTEELMLYDKIEYALSKYVIHALCLFGVIGNSLNLIVLTRKSLTIQMERLEKSAHIGLIALAVSDLLFCISALPHALKDNNHFFSPSIDFWLIYDVYGEVVINIFLLSSTWLTVAMAVSRYVAICYPLRARQHLRIMFTRIVIILVFLFSVVFNLPRFWMKSITFIECEEGGRAYFSQNGPMKQYKILEAVYMWLYFALGIAVPLILLAYCNVYLLRALHVSIKPRRQHSGTSRTSVSNSTNVVTLTLMIIIVFYIILVGPAEVLAFWKPYVLNNYSLNIVIKYSLLITICNTLQAINFAINFILYCIINVHFRKVIRNLILCTALREQLHKNLHGVNVHVPMVFEYNCNGHNMFV
jgi:hypothetical protein